MYTQMLVMLHWGWRCPQGCVLACLQLGHTTGPTYLCGVPGWQQVQVLQQGACLQAVAVALLVEWQPHQDVVPQARVADPGVLGGIGH